MKKKRKTSENKKMRGFEKHFRIKGSDIKT